MKGGAILCRSHVFAKRLGAIVRVCRDGHDQIELVVLGKFGDLSDEILDGGKIVVADLHGGVDENVGNVVIARGKPRDEPVERVGVRDGERGRVDQPRLMGHVKVQRISVFDAHNRTLRDRRRVVDAFDQIFGLSGSSGADDQLNHFVLPPTHKIYIRNDKKPKNRLKFIF